jgi:hypothetical protein
LYITVILHRIITGTGGADGQDKNEPKVPG